MYGYIFATAFTGNFGDVEALIDLTPPGIRFATLLYSGHALFAAWEGDTVTELATAASALATAGASGLDTAVGVLPSYSSGTFPAPFPAPPKFAAVQQHEAFVRVQIATGADLGFIQAAASISAVLGVCTTAGQYAGLVEVGASTETGLMAALNQVRAIGGISVQSTSLATFPEP